MCDFKQIHQEYIDQKKLFLQYCLDCEQFIFYPRSHCPQCWGINLKWRQALGKGRIYSYSIIHKSALIDPDDKVPYIYALVTLQEGVRLATRIVDCDPEAVYIDMDVEMSFAEKGGKSLLVFRPSAGCRTTAVY